MQKTALILTILLSRDDISTKIYSKVPDINGSAW